MKFDKLYKSLLNEVISDAYFDRARKELKIKADYFMDTGKDKYWTQETADNRTREIEARAQEMRDEDEKVRPELEAKIYKAEKDLAGIKDTLKEFKKQRGDDYHNFIVNPDQYTEQSFRRFVMGVAEDDASVTIRDKTPEEVTKMTTDRLAVVKKELSELKKQLKKVGK
jgi:hypothetical protein